MTHIDSFTDPHVTDGVRYGVRVAFIDEDDKTPCPLCFTIEDGPCPHCGCVECPDGWEDLW